MSCRLLLSATVAIGMIFAGCPIRAQQAPSDYDLQSVTPSVAATVSGIIRKGDQEHQISPGDLLTPAEHLALIQSAAGSQTLQLGGPGNATGGTVLLQSLPGSAVSSLVVPTGVTVVHDIGLASTVAITGNLTNYGSLFAISTNPQINSATFSASNIINGPNAIISTHLDSSAMSGLEVTNLVSGLSLNLVAANAIVNAGTISSAGNLSISAASITNVMSSANSLSAVLNAVGNLNLTAANIINTGLISSQTGSVNINALSVQNEGTISSLLANLSIVNAARPELGLAINSSSDAVISALRGHMHLGLTDETIKSAVDIKGGTYLASTIQINGGDGNLDVGVENMEGNLQVRAGIASLEVSNGQNGLTISSFDITGDPNLIFTGNGPFLATGFNSFGGIVRIDTSGDPVTGSITFTGPINTSPIGNGNGGLVSLNAGTDVVTGAISTQGVGAGSIGGDISITANGNVTTGQLTTSGLAGAGDITITSGGNSSVGGISSAAPFQPGASPTLTAMAFGQAQYGQVNFSGAVSLQALGPLSIDGIDSRSANAGGDVFLNSLTDAVVVADNGITSSGASSAAGNVDVTAATGVLINGGVRAASGGGLSGGTVSILSQDITVQDSPGGGPSGDVVTSYTGTDGSGGSVFLSAQNDINVQNITASAGSASGTGGTIVVAAGLSGTGNIVAGNLTTNGAGTTGSGGAIVMTTPGVISGGDLTARNPGGLAGQIVVLAGSAGGGVAPAQSGTLTLGNIDLTRRTIGGQLEIVNMGTSGNVVTGSINLSAAGDPTGRGGDTAIVAHGTVTLGDVSSTGPSSGEDLLISAGATTGTSITTGNINLNGGFAGGNIWFVRNPAAAVSTGTITQTGSLVNGVTFNGTPAGAQANLTATTTLSISPGAISGFNPGGFDSINIPAGTLTLNQPGSRILAPIVARGGNITLDSVNLTSAVQGVYNLVGSGNITINQPTALPGKVVQFFSTAGTVSVPAITTQSAGLPGAVALYGAQGVATTSLLTGSLGGGPIGVFAPGGAITFGTPGSTVGAISSAGGLFGGRIDLFAGGPVTIYNSPVTSNSPGPGGNITLKSMDSITLTSTDSSFISRSTDFNSTGSPSAGGISIDGLNGVFSVVDTTFGPGSAPYASMNANNPVPGAAGGIIVRSANGDIDLSDYSLLNSSNGSIRISSACCLTAPRNVVAPLVTMQSTGGGDLSLNSSITATNLYLSASGTGAILQAPAGVIQATNIFLSTADGSIGGGIPLQISDAQNLRVTTNGDALINEADTLANGLTLLDGFAGSDFTLTAGSALTITGPFSANNVTLITNANSDININGNLSGINSITLNAQGSGNIFAQPISLLTTANVTLTSNNGNIGTAAGPVRVFSTTVNATTNPPGQIFVVNLNVAPSPPTMPAAQSITPAGTSPLLGLVSIIASADARSGQVSNTTIIPTDVTRPQNWDEDQAEEKETDAQALSRLKNSKVARTGIDAALYDGQSFSAEEIAGLQGAGITCSVGIHEQVLHLVSGNLLAAPQKAIVIQTDLGNVKIGPGAMVLVMKTAEALAILDLHDVTQGDVSLSAEGKSVQLFPGFQVTTTRKGNIFEKINPAQGIAFRGLITQELSGQHQLFASDFSLASAIGKVGVLRDQYARGKGKAIDSIAKNAAIQQQVTGGHGSFKEK